MSISSNQTLFQSILIDQKVLNQILYCLDLKSLIKFCYLCKKLRVILKWFLFENYNLQEALTVGKSSILLLKKDIDNLCGTKERKVYFLYSKQYTHLPQLQQNNLQIMIKFGELLKNKKISNLKLKLTNGNFNRIKNHYLQVELAINNKRIVEQINPFGFQSRRNVLQYTNKNILSQILKFLCVQDIINITKSNKRLKILVEQSSESIHSYYKNVQQNILDRFNMNQTLLKAVEYFAHYEMFQEISKGKFASRLYNEIKPCKKLIQLSVNLANSQKHIYQQKLFFYLYKYKHVFYRLDLNQQQIQSLKQYLQSTSFETIEQLISQLSPQIEKHNIYFAFLYRYIQCLLILVENNINRYHLYQSYLVFNKYLFNVSKHIYFIERLFNKNTEKFAIYLNKNYTIEKPPLYFETVTNIFNL